ncbi:zinc-dependent metalloprotease [Rhodoferax sp. AJA081-3]|uniref:zinc-dependent metalloprotease n=1 Tax=Rhodoferax sp. AJA081-3 TaxID=2752316 RepID=UPI001ADF2885|nr:zinc-dependent metalloprotease [Rhodoferax sp. AJA081-3]QTN29483.1 zinc-dependent metalloprotease [Rhodoferax sp. AJA081-3]
MPHSAKFPHGVIPRVIATVLAASAAATWAQSPPAVPAPPASAASGRFAATPPSAAASAPRPDAAAPKPFAEVIKGAKITPGYFTLYQKDEKVWIEVKPEQFGSAMYFQINSTRGLGQSRIHSNSMLRGHLVEFHKLGNTVQLIAKNHSFTAKAGTPIATAVRESFTDSILAVTTAASAPHPERKSILIDANALLLADLPGMSTQLEATFRIPYAYDARNSGFVTVQSTEDMSTFNVTAHYAVPKLPVPPLVPSPAPTPPPPSNLPDNRSMLLGFYYSLSKLPDTPMASRAADSRVGHFVTRQWDFTDDMRAFPRKYLVNRWRMEKKDPAAPLSEPVQPIVYWLDKNIPLKYRAKVAEGVLEWNKAFEKIGFTHAIQVRQQADDATFDNNDTRHASVRWYVDTSDGALASGPSRTDPRTGEILDADISFSDGWTRLPRRRAVEQLQSVAQGNNHSHSHAGQHSADEILRGLSRGELPQLCEYEHNAMQEAGFALDLLAARGDIDPDSPEAEAIVLEQLKDVVTHEVGHTLGLTHNFRASTIYTLEQLENKSFTAVNGLSGSVMEYNALNIAPQGKKQGQYAQSTLGPYDYWAIEYAYKPLDAATESKVLQAIAGRSNEPLLAFANDLDAGLGNVEGMDPEVTRRDLGADPLAFAQRRMQLSQELWTRLQTRRLKPGEQYDVLLRNFVSANAQLDLAATVASKYVGGVVHLRDHADTGRVPLNPVPAATQRKALGLITDGLFRSNSFAFKPEFVARLVPNQFDRWFAGLGGSSLAATVNPDASISGAVLALQRASLDRLLADSVAARILDAPSKMAQPQKALQLSELYDTLQNAIWSELQSGSDIDAMRRNLQREHLRRVVNALIRPAATTPADAKSLMRANAQQLQQHIRAALGKPATKVTRAHLLESLDLLTEALKAPLQRAV